MNWPLMIIALLGWEHALYVSVTKVQYQQNQTWEVSCRLFNNDLEDGIRNLTGESVSLRTDDEISKSATLVADYIKEKVHLVANNGTALKLSWVKGEAENDTVWAYFTVNAMEIAAVENTLLIELFGSQENVVSIEREGQKKYLRFNANVKRLQLNE